jgi:hypothetical protein
LCRWKGFGPEEDSWVSIKRLKEDKHTFRVEWFVDFFRKFFNGDFWLGRNGELVQTTELILPSFSSYPPPPKTSRKATKITKKHTADSPLVVSLAYLSVLTGN